VTEPNWAQELGVHASDDALETELAAALDTEGSALTNRNAFSSFWGAVRNVVTLPIRALEGLMVAVVPMGFLRYSRGAWLVAKVVEFGMAKKPGIKARGNITFSRAGVAGNVNIQAGTIVSTGVLADGTRKRLVSLGAAVLPNGSDHVDVLCEAEQAGAAYNLPQDSYTVLVTTIAGIDAVTNGTGWRTVAGVDEEADTVLIDRVIEGQKSGGAGWTGGTKTYLDIALNFPGVVYAIVDGSQPRGRGTVDVIVMGGAGPPTTQLIDDLTAELDEQGKPITDDVLVAAPTPVTVNVSTQAVAYTADPRTDGAIQILVEGIVDSFFGYGVGSRYLRLGEDYVRARVTGAAIQDAGLKTLRFTTPAADVAIAANALAVAGTRVVAVVREDP
jgi:uncharacterized phage protein gp47/JayE